MRLSLLLCSLLDTLQAVLKSQNSAYASPEERMSQYEKVRRGPRLERALGFGLSVAPSPLPSTATSPRVAPQILSCILEPLLQMCTLSASNLGSADMGRVLFRPNEDACPPRGAARCRLTCCPAPSPLRLPL